MYTHKENRRHSLCHCINIRRAGVAVSAFYDRMLAPTGLTVNQFSLLVNLARLSEASVSQLAAKVGLDRTTLARTIKPLLEAALIDDISPKGHRNRVLVVTKKGQNCLTLGEPLWLEAQRIIEDKIGRKNLANLTEWLSELESL